MYRQTILMLENLSCNIVMLKYFFDIAYWFLRCPPPCPRPKVLEKGSTLAFQLSEEPWRQGVDDSSCREHSENVVAICLWHFLLLQLSLLVPECKESCYIILRWSRANLSHPPSNHPYPLDDSLTWVLGHLFYLSTWRIETKGNKSFIIETKTNIQFIFLSLPESLSQVRNAYESEK